MSWCSIDIIKSTHIYNLQKRRQFAINLVWDKLGSFISVRLPTNVNKTTKKLFTDDLVFSGLVQIKMHQYQILSLNYLRRCDCNEQKPNKKQHKLQCEQKLFEFPTNCNTASMIMLGKHQFIFGIYFSCLTTRFLFGLFLAFFSFSLFFVVYLFGLCFYLNFSLFSPRVPEYVFVKRRLHTCLNQEWVITSSAPYSLSQNHSPYDNINK